MLEIVLIFYALATLKIYLISTKNKHFTVKKSKLQIMYLFKEMLSCLYVVTLNLEDLHMQLLSNSTSSG